MKRFNEMTEAELLALDDEQTKNLIDYECAIEGVPMLPPHPGTAPPIEKCKPDINVYTVAGVYFGTAEDAARVLDAIFAASVIYKTDGYSDDKRFIAMQPGDYYFPKIEPEKAVSAESYAAWKEECKAVKEQMDEYKRAKSAYDSVYKERESIVKSVFDAIRDARQRSYDRDRLREEFTRYLELAEGNKTIALNFLKKVKDLSEFPELEAEFCPTFPEIAEQA